MKNIPATVSLFDVSGKLIATQTGREKISFDITKMAKGIYVVGVKAGTVQQAQKIVKEY